MHCLAEIELIFLRAGGVMLCLRFVAKQCWSHTEVVAEISLHSTKSLPVSHLTAPVNASGVAQEAVGDATRKMMWINWGDKTPQSGIGGKIKRFRQVSHLLLRNSLDIGLFMGDDGNYICIIFILFFVFSSIFPSLINPFYPDLQVFLLLLFLFSAPIPLGRRRDRAAMQYLGVYQN